jgi:hypothetical protein
MPYALVGVVFVTSFIRSMGIYFADKSLLFLPIWEGDECSKGDKIYDVADSDGVKIAVLKKSSRLLKIIFLHLRREWYTK